MPTNYQICMPNPRNRHFYQRIFLIAVFMPQLQKAWATTLADAVERVIDGVVNIRTKEQISEESQKTILAQPQSGDIFQYLAKNPLAHENFEGRGSGFFFKNRKWIVTNLHVVKDAQNIWVSTNRRKWASLPAQLVAYDERTDLAVLRVKDGDDSKTVLKFGSSENMRLGEQVFAIGNPYGYGHTVTSGILSAKGRSLGTGPYNDFLQTDAAMNPGNSGGPLLNTSGEVIGVNTAIDRSGKGISFAIPAEIAAPIVESIIKNGSFIRPRLGAYVSDVSDTSPTGKTSFGIQINKVVQNSPAHRAGILVGDIILGLNGTPAREIPDLQKFLGKLSPGKKLTLTIFRSPKTTNIDITLGRFDVDSSNGFGAEEF